MVVVLGERSHYHRYGLRVLYNCFNKKYCVRERGRYNADFGVTIHCVTTRLKVVTWLKSIRKQPSGGGFKLCLTCLLVFLVCFYTRILKHAISRYKPIRLCGGKKTRVKKHLHSEIFYTHEGGPRGVDE